MGLRSSESSWRCQAGKIEAQRIYRGAERALAAAQRANKNQRVKTIHAQIANRRKDFLHKFSTRLVRELGAFFVGNVNAAGVLFEEVNEAYSTVTCAACGSRSGPGGLEGLREREWNCTECGAVHDRDTNAAKSILARGHSRLAGGIPVL
jgi:transposase